MLYTSALSRLTDLDMKHMWHISVYIVKNYVIICYLDKKKHLNLN